MIDSNTEYEDIIPTGRIMLNINGGKSYYLSFENESYYNKLQEAYEDIKNDKASEYLYFAFITLCSATLESSLNSILIDHCVNHFGANHYKEYAEKYIGRSIPVKLKLAPGIISNAKYQTNIRSHLLGKLLALNTVRNKLLHNKEYLQEFESPPINNITHNKSLNFEIKTEKRAIDSLTKESCLEFAEALLKFKSCLLDPALSKELQPNELLNESKHMLEDEQ